MSHSFYTRQWQEAMQKLYRLAEVENPPPSFSAQGKLLPPKKLTTFESFRHFSLLYVGYLEVFRALEDCYDQVLHPQKRRIIKTTLEAVISRFLQVKKELELVSSDFSVGAENDCVDLTEALLQAKKNLSFLEIPIPKYFREVATDVEIDNTSDKRERKKKEDAKGEEEAGKNDADKNDETAASSSSSLEAFIKKRDVLDKYIDSHQAVFDLKESPFLPPRLSKEEAIKIIQRAERGRQGIVRARLMKELREEDQMRKKINEKKEKKKEKEKKAALQEGEEDRNEEKAEEEDEEDEKDEEEQEEERKKEPNYAATVIQSAFRGFLCRQDIKKKNSEEMVFIGMKFNPLYGRRGIKQRKEEEEVDEEEDEEEAEAEGDRLGDAGEEGEEERKANAAKREERRRKKAEKRDFSAYDPIQKEKQIRAQRKLKQADLELKYQEMLSTLDAEIEQNEGEEMKEKLWKERYDWILEEKNKTGKFPKDLSGFYRERLERMGIVVAKPKKEKKKTKEEKEKEKAEKAKLEAAKAAKLATPAGQKKAEEERRLAAEEASKVHVGPTGTVQHIIECVEAYKNEWSKLEEEENFQQTFSKEIAEEARRPVVVEKLEKEVDQKMQEYLDNLRYKLIEAEKAKKDKKKAKKKAKKEGEEAKKEGEGEKKEDGEGSKASSTKAKGSKKGKGKNKKAKAKKCCEGEKSCAHMPLGDQISLLVRMGILTVFRSNLNGKLNLSSFLGNYDVLQSDYNKAEVLVEPSFAQLRAILTEKAILPQGAKYMKENVPLLNAFLLYGPQGAGKTHLSRSIAFESNSGWMDLSPASIAHKLCSKAEIYKLIHLVFNVAVALQPAVIFIDQAEKLFLGNKGKKKLSSGASASTPGSSGPSGAGIGAGSELVKLRQAILAHKKLLTRQNRVIIVGNSSCPFSDRIDRPEFSKMFGKTMFGKQIFVPLPSDETRKLLIRKFVLERGLDLDSQDYGDGKEGEIFVGTLTKISEGYSIGSLIQGLSLALPPRIIQKCNEQHRLPDLDEVISSLSKCTFCYKGEYQQFLRYYELISGETERKRLKALATKQEEEEAKEQQGKNRRGPTKK